MRFRALAFAVLLLVCGCHSGPLPDAGLAGLRVKVIAEPKAGTPVQDAAISTYDTPVSGGYGPKATVDYANLDNIVVWLEPEGSPSAAPAPPALNVNIDPAKSASGIATVSVGQRVILRNAGPTAQTIYSVSDGNDFELPAVPPGGNGEYIVRSAGVVDIYAESSKDLSVELFATPTSWAQMAHAGQTLEFNNIPPGKYRLVSWHPRLPGTTDSIELTADHVTDASIKVGVNSLPKVSSDGGR